MNKWKKYFDKKVETYGNGSKSNDYADEKAYKNLRNVVDFVIQEYNPLQIVDIGCGNGMFSQNFASDRAVFGIDFSHHMLKHAKTRNLKSIRSNAIFLPMKSNFSDLTINMGMLQYIKKDEDIDQLFREMERITRSKGLIILSTLNADSLLRKIYGFMFKDDADHYDRMFSVDEINSRFEKFNINTLESYFFYTPLPFMNKSLSPGILHKVISSTFLIVGQKA